MSHEVSFNIQKADGTLGQSSGKFYAINFEYFKKALADITSKIGYETALFGDFKLVEAKINSLEFNKIERSPIGMGSETLEIDEITTEDYFIPSSGDCFMKCVDKIYQTQNETELD